MALHLMRMDEAANLLRSIFCIMLLFTASDVRAQETVLVKDSQGQCTIVVPAKEETVLREAAEDLAYHLEYMR